MRIHPQFLFLLATATVARGAGAEPSLWRYVHPEAKIFIGLDLARAKQSATGKLLARQLTSMPNARVSGSELLDMADRVLLSSPGAEEGEHAPMILAVEGRMDRAQLKKILAEGTGVERFHGVDLLVPPRSKKSDLVMAVVTERLGVLGDRASVEAALTAESTKVDAAVLRRAMELAEGNEIWMVAVAPPGSLAGDAMSGPEQLKDIESMDLGICLQKGLGLRLALGMKTEASAQSLVGMAQMLIGMAVSDAKKNPQVAEIARSLKLNSDGTNVRMSVDVPLAQLERGMSGLKAGVESASRRTLEGLVGVAPVAAALPKPAPQAVAEVKPVEVKREEPVVPKTRTIRVVGLETGEKEITYTTGGQKQ